MPVGDPRAGERFLVDLEAGTRGHQDRHVTPPAGLPFAGSTVSNLPPLLVQLVQQAGERAGLGFPHIWGVALDGAFDQHHRRSLGGGRPGRLLERNVSRLQTRLRLKHLVEHCVERLQHRRVGAEVRRDPLCAAGERPVLDAFVDGDVGAAEAVDRLLGVPDDGEAPGDRCQRAPFISGLLVAGEEQGELGLDGVGVLELVDQHGAEAAAEVLARRGGRRGAGRAPRTAGRRSRLSPTGAARLRRSLRTIRCAGVGRAGRSTSSAAPYRSRVRR